MPENARSALEVDLDDAATEVVADHDEAATKPGPRIFSRDDYTPGRAWR